MKKLLLSVAVCFSISAFSQIETPQPSPLSTVKQTVGLTEIEVEYSRPGAKDREIFGALVPYGKIWRTGANASAKISFSEPVKLNGNEVPAGNYALYTIPNKENWTVIIHKNTAHWGVGDYKQDEDQVRFDVPVKKAGRFIENFAIGFDHLRETTGNLFLAWANTMVEINIETNTDEKVTAQIEAFMNPDPSYRPYYSAASYYLNTGKDLNKALTWAEKACQLKEAFWVYHLKAKIEYKMGQKKDAIQTAEKSKNLAQEAGNLDYVSLNDELIKKCKM